MNPCGQITHTFNGPFLYGPYLLPMLIIIDHNTDRGNALLTLNNIKFYWKVGCVVQNIPDIFDKYLCTKSGLPVFLLLALKEKGILERRSEWKLKLIEKNCMIKVDNEIIAGTVLMK